MNTHRTFIALVVLCLVSALGCVSERHIKKADEQPATKTIVELNYIPIGVDDTLAELCGMPQTRAYFEEDSDEIIPESAERLDDLASCMKQGALEGEQKIVIVGHTDPQGDAEYNARLGKERALSVATYLVARGVDPTRITTRSSGERDAEEDHGEYAFHFDRRVDIRLLD